MAFEILSNEYEKIISSVIEDCNIISIDKNEFPSLEYILDIQTINSINQKINVVLTSPNNFHIVYKIIVSIVSNKSVTLTEVDNILSSLSIQYEHPELILGIGKNDIVGNTILKVFLLGNIKRNNHVS